VTDINTASSMEIPSVRFAWNPFSASSTREFGQKVAGHRPLIYLASVFPHGEVLIFDLLSAAGEFFGGEGQTGGVG
jgi:hypothetical protein